MALCALLLLLTKPRRLPPTSLKPLSTSFDCDRPVSPSPLLLDPSLCTATCAPLQPVQPSGVVYPNAYPIPRSSTLSSSVLSYLHGSCSSSSSSSSTSSSPVCPSPCAHSRSSESSDSSFSSLFSSSSRRESRCGMKRRNRLAWNSPDIGTPSSVSSR